MSEVGSLARAVMGVVEGTLDPLASPATVQVPVDGWRAAAEAVHAEGGRVFEWLSAVDRGQVVEVAVHVRDADADPAGVILTTVAAGPRGDASDVPSVRDLWAGAAWHERETAEMFGLRFAGHDTARLLLRALPDVVAPLLRRSALPRRVGTPWPGRVEPGETDEDRARRARRGPQLPPGVHTEWTTEDAP